MQDTGRHDRRINHAYSGLHLQDICTPVSEIRNESMRAAGNLESEKSLTWILSSKLSNSKLNGSTLTSLNVRGFYVKGIAPIPISYISFEGSVNWYTLAMSPYSKKYTSSPSPWIFNWQPYCSSSLFTPGNCVLQAASSCPHVLTLILAPWDLPLRALKELAGEICMCYRCSFSVCSIVPQCSWEDQGLTWRERDHSHYCLLSLISPLYFLLDCKSLA